MAVLDTRTDALELRLACRGARDAVRDHRWTSTEKVRGANLHPGLMCRYDFTSWSYIRSKIGAKELLF